MLALCIIMLVTITVNCSKPSSEAPASRAKPVVRWFRNEQGFITSDVKTNDITSWTSSDGSKSGIHFDGGSEIHDPLEDAPEFATAFRDANDQAEAFTQRWTGQMGRVHLYWKKKKEVLRNKYKIDWKSPAELNPMTTYD